VIAALLIVAPLTGAAFAHIGAGGPPASATGEGAPGAGPASSAPPAPTTTAPTTTAPTTTAPTTTAPTTTTTAPPKVAVVGDSLVEFQEDASPTMTEGVRQRGWAPAVQGVGGSSTFEIRTFYRDEIAGADGVVFVAGANDVPRIEDEPDQAAAVGRLRQQFDAAMADMAGARCVVWPTVIEAPNFYWAGPTYAATAVNDLIRSEAAAHPSVRVVDWSSLSAPHPEWFIPDLLHHTPAGEAAFRQALLDAMADCLNTRP